jgi:outer membrane protein
VANRAALASMAFAALAAAALPARAQTMLDALVLAYQNNPTLLAQRAHLRAQDEEISQALAGWRPTVTVTENVGREVNHGNANTIVGPAQTFWTTPNTAALTLTQPIYTGGKTEAQLKQSEDLVLVERARLDLIEQQVMLQAATFYMDVVRDQADLKLNINNELVLQRQLEATRDEFRVGEVTRTDVSQAEARLEGAKAARLAALNQLQISRAAFRNVVGASPGDLIDPGEPAGLPNDREEALGAAQTQNGNVKVQDYTVAAARDNIDVVFAGLMPTFSIQGQVAKVQDSSLAGISNEYAAIEAVIAVPIYTGGLIDAQVREAKQNVGQQELLLAAAQRQASQDASTAWENLRSARAQSIAFQATIDADAVALEGTEEEQKAGLRTILDILNAEQELLSSRVSLVTAHHDSVVAGYTLLNSMGRLTARDRQLPVELYDPSEHYYRVRNQWFGTSDR